MTSRSRRCVTRWSAASTGLTRPRCTGSDTRKSSSGGCCATIPRAIGPYVFTKCGLVWDEQRPMVQSLRIGEPSSLRREVEQSLTRLGVEQIDLYQMHWPAEDGTPVELYWQTLLDLKKEGKVRAVGLSNHKVDRLEAAERLGHVDTLQPPFSPIRRDALAAELPWCQRARHRRHRLQPDAIGTADRIVYRSASGGARQRRLAVAVAGVPGASPAEQPGTRRRAAVRSPRVTTRPSAPSPSPGRSQPQASPARSSAPATRNRSTDGSPPDESSSRKAIGQRLRAPSSAPARGQDQQQSFDIATSCATADS